ncbi:hypothetical protein LSM04_005603 [Trypanosoma melophagium]|uniref:uncharacterized protein n=1 Tax=Trypanosoma melophagium TaxID=715481 RepID=UPI00351A92C6|nr:hypothetical protein LSM04_005603 [Trypanosoma melophagium]
MGGGTLLCTLEVRGGGERTRRTLNVDRPPRTLRELAELLKAQDLRLQYGTFDLCVDRSEVEQPPSATTSKSESHTQKILCDRDVVELFAAPPPVGRLKFVVTLPERSTKIASSILADDELVHLCIYHPNNHNSHNQKITEVGKVGGGGGNSNSNSKATLTVTEKRFITPRRAVREALIFAVRGAIPQPLPLSTPLELYAVGDDENDLRPLNDENAVSVLLRSCLAEHTACRLTYRFPADIAAEHVAPAAASKPVNEDRVAAATASSDPRTKENVESDRTNSTKEEDATTVVDVYNNSKKDFATNTDVSDPTKDDNTVSDRSNSVTEETSTAPPQRPSDATTGAKAVSDRTNFVTEETTTAANQAPSDGANNKNSEVVNVADSSEREKCSQDTPINIVEDEGVVSEPPKSVDRPVSLYTESYSKIGNDAELVSLRASDEDPPCLEIPHLVAEEVKEPEEVLKEENVTSAATNLLPNSKIEIECSLRGTSVAVFPFTWQPNEPNLLKTVQKACMCALDITSMDDMHLYNHEGAPVRSDEQICTMLDSVLQSGRTRIRFLLGLGNPCTTGLPLNCYVTWGKQEVALSCSVQRDNALNDLQSAILEEYNVTFKEIGDLKLFLHDDINGMDEQLTDYDAYFKLKASGADGVVLHILVSNPCPTSLRCSPEPNVTAAAMAFAAEVSFVVGDRVHARDVLPFFEDCLNLHCDVQPCGGGARDFVRVMVLLLAPPGSRQLPPAELVALVRDTAALATAETKKGEGEQKEREETSKGEEESNTKEKKEEEEEEEKEKAAVEAVGRASVVARLFAARRPLDALARFFRRVFRSLLPADGGRTIPLALVTRQLALAGLPDARGLLRRDRTILAELHEKDYTELLLRLYNSNTDVVCRAVVAVRLSGISTIRSRRVMTRGEEELMRNDFLYELRHAFDGIRTSDISNFLQTHELITEPRFQCLLSVVGDLLATHPVQNSYHWLVDRFKGKMADALDVKLRTFEDSAVSTPQLYNLCWNILKPELHHLSLLSESQVGSAFAFWAFFAVQLVCVNRKLEFPPVPLVDLQQFSLVEEIIARKVAVEEEELTEAVKAQGGNSTPGTDPKSSSTTIVELKPAPPAAPVPFAGKKIKIKYKYSYLCRDLRQDPRVPRPVK